MSNIDDVNAKITADSSGYTAAMNAAHDTTKKATDSMGEALKAVGDVLELYVVSKLVEFGKEAVDEFNKATRSAISIGVQIKATGDSVGWTAGQLDIMAANLSAVSIYGKEEILAGVTESLLKFHNISGDTFAKAQQDIIDYASVSGKSLEAASQTIGRALENPAQSFMILKRAGIDLVAMGLKPTIENLMSTGKVGEAQSIILHALEGSFKDMAVQMKATPFGKITSDINIFKEAMIPIGKIVETAMVPFYNILARISDAFMNLSPSTQKIIVEIGMLVVAVGTLIPVLGLISATILPALVTGFGLLFTVVLPIIVIFAALALAGQVVYDNWKSLKAAAVDVWDWVAGIVKSAVSSIISALEKIPGVAKYFENLKTASSEAMGTVISAGGAAVDFLKDSFKKPMGELENEFSDLSAKVKTSLKSVGASNKTASTEMLADWETAFEKTASLAQTMTDSLQKAFNTVATGITDTLTRGATDWRTVVGGALQTMLSAIVDWGIKAMMVTLNIDKAMQALFAVSPILGIALIAGLIAATAAIGTPPKMAAGGMFDRPTNVTVGEAGPEVILPVTRLSNGKMGVQTDGMGAGASSGGSHSSSGSGTSPSSTGDLHVSVMLDSRPILHTIARASRTGKLVIHPKSVRVEPINT